MNVRITILVRDNESSALVSTRSVIVPRESCLRRGCYPEYVSNAVAASLVRRGGLLPALPRGQSYWVSAEEASERSEG